jgi:hypothetical protein
MQVQDSTKGWDIYGIVFAVKGQGIDTLTTQIIK